MTVENTDSFDGAGHPVRLSAQLVVDIRAKAEEMIPAICLRNIGAHLQGLAVFQENSRPGNRRAFFGQNCAFDGSGKGVAPAAEPRAPASGRSDDAAQRGAIARSAIRQNGAGSSD